MSIQDQVKQLTMGWEIPLEVKGTASSTYTASDVADRLAVLAAMDQTPDVIREREYLLGLSTGDQRA